jgi:tripartite-type tricarboxylate transporter receptor subunit TctC
MKLILSAEAGSIFDRVGRAFSAGLQKDIELQNVGDSSGVGGAEAGARAPKDGSTLLICNKGAITSHPHTAKTYRTADFAPICQIAEAPIAVAVGAKSALRTLADLIDAARRKPDTVSYSTPNPYHTQRLAMSAFCKAHGVPFKFMVLPGGNAAAIQKIADGTVDFAFLAAHNFVAPRKAGDIRILAVAHGSRLPFLQDDPTFREQGYDLVTAIWLGLFAPTGTPEERLQGVREAAPRASQESSGAITGLHMVPAFLDQQQFGKKVAADAKFHEGVLRELGAI